MKALGCFRGKILDGGVSTSTNGYPQLVLKVTADEMYDEAKKEWAEWEEFDWPVAEANDRTIVAYLILFGEKGATFSCDQVKKITGWEGDSFAALQALDLTGVKIQWRNEENTYDGDTKVQVAWVDTYDAAPGGSIRKLDAKDITALDTKFAKFLKTENKPQSAGSGRGASKLSPADVAGPEEKPKRGGRGRGKKKKEDTAEVPAATNPDTPPTTTGTESPAEVAEATEPPAGTEDLFKNNGPCTKKEAWADVTSKKPEALSLDKLGAIWLETIDVVAPGKQQADLTDDNWSAVRAGVMDTAQIPF